MLQLTRLSGPAFALNPDLIERAEATPDTVVTLVNGSKYVVRESLEELVELVRQYRVDLIAAAGTVPQSSLAIDPTVAPRHRARRELSPDGTVVALHPGEE